MGLTWKPRVLTALLGAAVASGLTMLILILVEATDVLLPTDTKFGIVFDAGSSHTSLFVYRWPADKENDTGVVSQALVCQAKEGNGSSGVAWVAQSGPGISSYASNPAQAGESLQGCLEEALALIPEAQQRKTPLFLGATAGMRLLSQKNSSQARDIFEAVTQVLSKSPLDFWGAELLAGQDEGALGWITINYVLGMLVKYSFSGEWIQPLEGTLVGALDMGGASTQITFVPGGPILDKSTQTTFRLYGSEHSVYTHSYLCFGRDQMLSRLLAQLVQSSSGPLVRHPCYHSGYWATLSPAALYESPCVHTAAPPELAGNLTVEGTGNPGACISAIRGLFNFSSCQGRGHCAFNGVYQPPVRGQFYVSSLPCPPQGLSLLPRRALGNSGAPHGGRWGLCLVCPGLLCPGPTGHHPSAQGRHTDHHPPLPRAHRPSPQCPGKTHRSSPPSAPGPPAITPVPREDAQIITPLCPGPTGHHPSAQGRRTDHHPPLPRAHRPSPQCPGKTHRSSPPSAPGPPAITPVPREDTQIITPLCPGPTGHHPSAQGRHTDHHPPLPRAHRPSPQCPGKTHRSSPPSAPGPPAITPVPREDAQIITPLCPGPTGHHPSAQGRHTDHHPPLPRAHRPSPQCPGKTHRSSPPSAPGPPAITPVPREDAQYHHPLCPQAFSNFYYTFHFLNLTSKQPLATVNATIWEFCQRPWKQVEASSPGQDRWLRDYCTSGLYILTLLLEGYGFSEETWPGIEFRKQAGGTEMGWTLGYMLNLTSMIPAEVPAQWRAQSYGIWAAGVVFAVLTLAVTLGAVAGQLLWPQG
ncbi:ectonucleoside triphosphate diphosphohydrolase 8 isoform X3 [Prionailurus iriomotensis]